MRGFRGALTLSFLVVVMFGASPPGLAQTEIK